MDTGLVNCPAAGGTPNADSVQSRSGEDDGTFQALLLELGVLQVPSGQTNGVPSESPAGTSGEEQRASLVIAAALVPDQVENVDAPSAQSDVSATLGPLPVVVQVPLSAEESTGEDGPSKTEKAKDVPDKVADETSQASPSPVPVPVELWVDLVAPPAAIQGNQPMIASSKEISPSPPTGIPRPAPSANAGTSRTIARQDLPEPTANTVSKGPSQIPDGTTGESRADPPPAIPASIEAAHAAIPKPAQTVDASIVLPEDAPTDAADLSLLPTPLDKEGAVTSNERGSRQADAKAGARLNASAETQTDDAFRLFATPPAAARGERPVTALSSLEGPASHANQPPATPSSSSVYFEVQPPDAGRVRVHLALSEQTVYARVVTEQSEVQDFLLRNVGRLETQLQSYGLDVGRFHVEVDRQNQGRSQHAWTFAGERDTPVPNASTAGEPIQEVKALEIPWHPHRVNLFV